MIELIITPQQILLLRQIHRVPMNKFVSSFLEETGVIKTSSYNFVKCVYSFEFFTEEDKLMFEMKYL